MFGLNKTAVHSISFDADDQHYVLQLCPHPSLNMLAASSTNCTVKLYDHPALTYIRALPGHSARINDVSTSPAHGGLILSAGDDGKVFVWDARAEAAAHQLQLPNGTEATSVALGGTTESMLAVGTPEQVRIWDIRAMGAVAGVLEPHSDDVSQVRFHPTQRQMLVSAGMDGLLCVHDTSLGLDEDNATIAVLNAEQPVDRFGFSGTRLHCFTTVEGLSIFDLTSLDRVVHVPDMRPQLSAASGKQVDFLISAHCVDEHFYLAAGDQNGCVMINELTPQQLKPVAVLGTGHREPVRCLYWHPQLTYLITGGEDSQLCCWGEAGAAPEAAVGDGSSPKMRTEKENRRVNPY